MISTLIHSNDADFDKVVLGSELPVLVDFWAEWCGPCHMIAPMVDQLSSEHKGNLLVIKVNVDDSPEVAHRYGIMSIPTLIVFDKGAPVEGTIGVVPFESLNKCITGLLKTINSTDQASA